jgi:hypothetical protein
MHRCIGCPQFWTRSVFLSLAELGGEPLPAKAGGSLTPNAAVLIPRFLAAELDKMRKPLVSLL